MKISNIAAVKKIGQEVELAGWVHARRDHGKIIFIDLRDRSGIIQVVMNEKLYTKAAKLGPEYVIKVNGLVKERPENMQNDKISTGKAEIEAKEIEILSKSKVPPFEISKNTKEISEDTRMKYRYLDIRSDRVKKALGLRHKVVKFVRDYLDKKEFWEIETPCLTKSTPEGARDYLVPARLQPGSFYALPQAPQQFKQLLMVAGIEKYFQLARCFRDEDPRGDRQPEHTQIDLEMSFVEQKDVMKTIEEMIIAIIKKVAPEKNISSIPFPVVSYKEAIERYKTDRPDLRKNKKDKNEFAFCWVVDFPFFEPSKNSGQEKSKWTFTHNPFSAPMPEDEEKLMSEKDIESIRTTQYDIVLNGFEIGGGSIRSHKPNILAQVLKILGYNEAEIKDKFGHMLEAFEYGVPPHGGIALGLDRIVMILANEDSIREVIAFPKTGDGRDLMMGAPGSVSQDQLDELHIKSQGVKKENV